MHQPDRSFHTHGMKRMRFGRTDCRRKDGNGSEGERSDAHDENNMNGSVLRGKGGWQKKETG